MVVPLPLEYENPTSASTSIKVPLYKVSLMNVEAITPTKCLLVAHPNNCRTREALLADDHDACCLRMIRSVLIELLLLLFVLDLPVVCTVVGNKVSRCPS